VSWLSTINDRNRSNLSRLEISAYRPEEVWQRPNGERKLADSLQEPMYPRNPHFQFRTPLRYRLVESINPAVETIFQLLGQKNSTHKLTVNFKLRDGEYPGQGIFLREDDHYPQYNWCSMDLPSLVEKLRTLSSPLLDDSDSSMSLIEVIWTGKCPKMILERGYRRFCRTTIQDHLENIKDRGWEIKISSMEGEDWEWGRCDRDGCEEKHIPTFVLRRKPLEEPLTGDNPNPWPDAGVSFRPGDEEYGLEQRYRPHPYIQ
jgi:hypothetical protein